LLETRQKFGVKTQTREYTPTYHQQNAGQNYNAKLGIWEQQSQVETIFTMQLRENFIYESSAVIPSVSSRVFSKRLQANSYTLPVTCCSPCSIQVELPLLL
jgi:hypothetical protein